MPAWQRIYVISCSAIIGYCLAYVLCDYGVWPRLAYFPYERQLELVRRPVSPVPMLYLGTVLWGIGGAAAAGGLAWIATRLRRRPVSDRWLRLFGGWALAAFAYAGLYYTWALWPF